MISARRWVADRLLATHGDAYDLSYKTHLCGIYLIGNKVSGKHYVGSSIDIMRRLAAHIGQLRNGSHDCAHMRRSWKKWGEDNFYVEILEICLEADVIASEQWWLDETKATFNTARCTENGMLGRKHTEESKKKMADRQRGKKYGPRIFTTEHRAAISAAKKGKKQKKRPPMSDSQRAKISQTRLERFASGVISKRTKPVEIYGVRYESLKAAAAANGTTIQSIYNRLKTGTVGRYL